MRRRFSGAATRGHAPSALLNGSMRSKSPGTTFSVSSSNPLCTDTVTPVSPTRNLRMPIGARWLWELTTADAVLHPHVDPNIPIRRVLFQLEDDVVLRAADRGTRWFRERLIGGDESIEVDDLLHAGEQRRAGLKVDLDDPPVLGDERAIGARPVTDVFIDEGTERRAGLCQRRISLAGRSQSHCVIRWSLGRPWYPAPTSARVGSRRSEVRGR